MNTLAHFLINFIILNQFIDARKNILIIFISSAAIDLDHIPYILKNFKKTMKNGLNEECRTLTHELIGLVIVSLILILLSFFINGEILLIIWLCFFLHLIVDYLTGTTRPFYPFLNYKVTSPIQKIKRRNRILFEIVSTIILLFLFLYN
jgi:membrane-bound metal-dependent hydrolase YbcI (DUF457 family)